MTEKAIILEVKESTVKLMPIPNEGCSSCSGSCDKKHTIFTTQNSLGLPLKAGTVVEIRVSNKTKFLQAFISLILPLIMAGIGFKIGKDCFQKNQTLFEAILSISFFVLSCLAVFLITRKKELPGKIEILSIA